MAEAIRVPNPPRVPPPERRPNNGYTLLPFRFLRFDDSRVLLVNDIGEFAFISSDLFDQLVSHSLDAKSLVFSSLKSRYFVADHVTPDLIKIMAERYRLKKDFLAGFTKLHIFVVSLRCDHSCLYCQVSRQSANKSKYDMSRETADRSLALVFQSPAEHITIEFQGGEPLLNFELVKYIVARALELNRAHGKRIDFVVATNLAFVTDEVLDFCKAYDIHISTSLDGPAFIHNANRPRPGQNSYEVTIAGIRRTREVLGYDKVAALMTTSRLSLEYPIEIIDEYLRQEFRSIFLRPISPYGFAVRTRDTTGYEFDKFMQFYQKGLDYIIRLNRGGINFQEAYAKILLTKILTPFGTRYVDLQSPAGLGIGVVVYNYDGDVYASDEARMLAEMRDFRFRLGNVHKNSYEEIFLSDALRSSLVASCVETLPGCSDCAFQTFCGADPVYHHTAQGDIFGHRPTSEFHKKNFDIIKLLLQYMTDNAEARKIFLAWVMDKSVSRMNPEGISA